MLEKNEKDIIKSEVLIAKILLKKAINDKDKNIAFAAKKILDNRQLFDEFVRLRINKRRKNENNKNNWLTIWKNIIPYRYSRDKF